VRSVGDGSPAEQAGVAKGDLIVAAGEAEVTTIDGLYRALDSLAPDATLELGLVRGTEERTVTVKFDEKETEAAR